MSFYITCCSTCSTHLPKQLNHTLHCHIRKCFPSPRFIQKTRQCFTVLNYGNDIIHLEQCGKLQSLLVNYQVCSTLPMCQAPKWSRLFHVVLSPNRGSPLCCANQAHPYRHVCSSTVSPRLPGWN